MKLAAVAIIALLLPAAASAAELTSEQMKVLTEGLNDPESARLRNVVQSTKFSDVLCGEVNWMNKQGGYDGSRKFWLDPADGKAAIDPHPAYTVWAEAMGCP